MWVKSGKFKNLSKWTTQRGNESWGQISRPAYPRCSVATCRNCYRVVRGEEERRSGHRRRVELRRRVRYHLRRVRYVERFWGYRCRTHFVERWWWSRSYRGGTHFINCFHCQLVLNQSCSLSSRKKVLECVCQDVWWVLGILFPFCSHNFCVW